MGADKLVVGLAGPWPSLLEISWLKKWQPYGVILFSRNVTGPAQLNKLCSYLQVLVPGLQIMADHEGGPVSQLAQALGRPPAAWTLGKIDDTDLTRRVHERTAELMVAAGVNWVLAPCADVMTHPRNPVIGVRAFGADVNIVSRHVRAAVQGLLAGGVQVCLKHWPGHGSSGQDSHLERAIMAPELVKQAAIPFHAGLAAGAKAMMVGHLCAGEGTALPATLDADFLAATRRDLTGADGSTPLIIADDITMGGLREPMASLGVSLLSDSGKGLLEPVDLPLAWLEALVKAGCDLLLIRGLPLCAFPVSTDEVIDSEYLPPIEDVPVVHIGPYEETRSQSAIGEDFFSLDKSVLWVDLTVGDRWAVAAGSGLGQERALEDVLDRFFGAVVRVIEGHCGSETEKSFSRVVLVSHRPISWDLGNPPAWLADLADSGQIVVMGHPSLEADFFAALPADLKAEWQITPVFDVTGADLTQLN